MIWLKVAGDVVSWSSWLWQQRESIGPMLQKMGDLGDLLADPGGAVRRIGPTIVFGQPDGGERVLAFIEQTSPKLDTIEQAVKGLNVGQAAISTSLSSLQTISMISLGVTALTPAVLVAQFVALRARLNRIEAKLESLAKKIDAMNERELKSGLEFLEMGDDFLMKRRDKANGHDRLKEALSRCVDSWKYYGSLLEDELDNKKAELEAVRILSRHFSVALAATAACQIGLEQDDHALSHVQKELPLLKKATQWIFQRTAGKDPARFLAPELGQHQVTLSSLAELFRQAKDAGAIETSHTSSESDLFEQLRTDLYRVGRPSFTRRNTWLVNMVTELQQATATVEEMNRVKGIECLVKQARSAERSATDVVEEVRRRLSEEKNCPYVVWAI